MNGQQLKAWRKRMRLTIKEASAEFGVSTATFSRWEASKEELVRYVGRCAAAISMGIPEIDG